MLTLTTRYGNHTPQLTASGLEVTAEWEWLLRGPAQLVAQAQAALPGVSELLADGIALVNFGNSVGLLDIPHLGRVNVVSGKWGESHYHQMLADLTAIVAGLPFSASSATALPYDRSVAARDDVLYHMFVYLRHILSDSAPLEQQLLPALHQVLHDPHQRFLHRRETVPLALAQSVDAISLAQIAAGAGGMIAAPPGLQDRLSLVQLLGGQLPEHVNERQLTHTVDTLENRFVKMALDVMVSVIARMRATMRSAGGTSAFTQRVLQDCVRMGQSLQPILQHSLWAHVGQMSHLPTSSTVLQARRGYREVYQHFIRLRLATQVPLSPAQVRDLLEAKDIAQLYEIWCFFTLVRVLVGILGPTAHASQPRVGLMSVDVPWDFSVRWNNHVRLLYNPRFSRSQSLNRRSYSVPLRPDIALEVPGPQGTRLHLFDAKFKVVQLDFLMPDEHAAEDDEAANQAGERRGVFKRGDLYKMHTYHDAIIAVETVWILYPGTESQFFHRQTGVRTTLTDQTLPDEPDGVGAIALQPDDREHPALRDVLMVLLGK